MFYRFGVIFLVCTGFFMLSCTKDKTQPVRVFSAAVAGHAYGNPSTYTTRMYTPFVEKLAEVNSKDPFDYLFLTGDVVAKPEPEYWDNFLHQLDSVGIKNWYISPGNHDVSAYMDEHVQPFKYYAFNQQQSLFLVLNTSHAGWTLDSAQLVMVENELENINAERVFVFSHQLWWLNNPPDSMEVNLVTPNSYALFEGESSFWEDAFPLFENLQVPVYFFAGDMGCFFSVEAYYEHHIGNYHFYGSGMGGNVADNFLQIQIFQDGSVKIDRVDF